MLYRAAQRSATWSNRAVNWRCGVDGSTAVLERWADWVAGRCWLAVLADGDAADMVGGEAAGRVGGETAGMAGGEAA